MANIYRFVDSIGASPTTLLDLNDYVTFHVESYTADPAPMARAISTNLMRDGNNVASSTFLDREIILQLGIMTEKLDVKAAAIQALGRLLNSEGQWLMVQIAGTTNSFFFRTKRAEITQVASLTGASATSTVTITIPAEPFAYGLPETGTFTINNDPTAATNPMSYVFPDVKGDVTTPLSLKFAATTMLHTVDACMLSSCAAPDAPVTPIYTGSATSGGASGWSFSGTTSDSTAIGGTTNTFTKTSGSSTLLVVFTFPSVPLGDYRIVGRLKSASSDATVTVTPSYIADPVNPTEVTLDGATWGYYDFGVMRLPVRQENSNPPGIYPSTATSAKLTLVCDIASASGVVSADILLAIPAGLDDAQASSLLIAGGGHNLTDAIVVDAILGEVSGVSGSIIPCAGSAPVVVPGQANVLTMIRNTDGLDTKTDSLVTTWQYYPRYLYMRPATT